MVIGQDLERSGECPKKEVDGNMPTFDATSSPFLPSLQCDFEFSDAAMWTWHTLIDGQDGLMVPPLVPTNSKLRHT